jgi:hypothetical protein
MAGAITTRAMWVRLVLAAWVVTLIAPSAARAAGSSFAAATAQQKKKDYLTPLEADQIRDATTISERVRLFLGFAADRLRKIDYEMERKDKDRQWNDRMWGLINSYTGCVDDAADALEAGLEKQENLRPGTKELDKRTKEFLPKVKELRENPLLAGLKSELDDAIQSTQDAAETAQKVAKELSAAPERRRPS